MKTVPDDVLHKFRVPNTTRESRVFRLSFREFRSPSTPLMQIESSVFSSWARNPGRRGEGKTRGGSKGLMNLSRLYDIILVNLRKKLVLVLFFM